VNLERGLTQRDIEEGLRRAGVTAGAAVEVHASLSAFGHVAGGADTVIRALMAAVGPEGALVMPAFLYSPPQPLTPLDVSRGLTLKLRILPPDHTERSGMGVIADTFRRRPDVLTGEGLHRVAAWGRDLEAHSHGFHRLIDTGGLGLLLGVDIYRLSAMHYVEAHLPAAIRRTFQPPEEVRRHYPEEAWYIETGAPPVRAWYKIQDEAYRRGFIRDTAIGPCRCMSFVVRDVVGLYEEALRTDPLGLYGLR
jgi:aminoglycoside N3'-acetyltransferase